MVKSCCAVGCKNRFLKGSSITFHTFPREPTLQGKWTMAINRLDSANEKPWHPTAYDYVCSAHFLPSDFIISRHAHHKRLKKDVVPSVSSVKNKGKATRPHLPCQQKPAVELESESKTCSSTVDLVITHVNHIRIEHCYAADLTTIKKRCEEARDQFESARKELFKAKKREKRAKVMVSALMEEVKDMRTQTEETNDLLESYKDLPLDLFAKPANEYTEDQKQFAANLYLYGPKVYEFLREKMNLPHPLTLRRWLGNISSGSGMSAQVLEMLKKKEAQTNFMKARPSSLDCE